MAVETYNAKANLNARTRAADVPNIAGAGLQQAGQGLGAVANDLADQQARSYQKKLSLYMDSQEVALATRTNEFLQEAEQTGEYEGLQDKYHNDINGFIDSAVNGLANEDEKDFLRQKLNLAAMQYGQKVVERGLQNEVAKEELALGQAKELALNTIITQPSQWPTAVERYQRMLGNTKLSAIKKEESLIKFKQDAVSYGFMARVQTNPSEVLAALDGGALDGFLEAGDKLRLKMAAQRELEQQSERGNIQAAFMFDNAMSAMRAGQAVDFDLTDEQITGIVGKNRAPAAIANFRQLQQVAPAIGALRESKASRQRVIEEELGRNIDPFNFNAESTRQNIILQEAQKIERDLTTNPAQALATLAPEKTATLLESIGTQGFEAAMDDYQSFAKTQGVVGFAPLPKVVADNVLMGLADSENVPQAVNNLSAVLGSAGKYRQQISRQIDVTAKTPYAMAARLNDDNKAIEFVNSLKREKDNLALMNSDDKKAINEKLTERLNAFYKAQRFNLDAPNLIARDLKGLSALAYDKLQRQGLSADSAAEEAYNAFNENYVVQQSDGRKHSFIIPPEYSAQIDTSNIVRGLDAARKELSNKEIKGGKNDTPDNIARAAQNGTWVSNDNLDGVVLVDERGLAFEAQDGGPYEIKFRDAWLKGVEMYSEGIKNRRKARTGR